MSLYVRLLTNFYSHRKTAKLRATLGYDALWLPPRLWAYAAENQPDGVFKDYTAAELATLLGYTKDANAMLEAMLQAGFLDSDPLRIHDWAVHNGFHLVFSARAKHAAEARWQRERTKEKVQERRGDEASIASSIGPLPGNGNARQSARGPAPREMWQLLKDRKAAIEALQSERDKQHPDEGVVTGLICELGRIKKAIAERGGSTAKPRCRPASDNDPVLAGNAVEAVLEKVGVNIPGDVFHKGIESALKEIDGAPKDDWKQSL